MHYLLYCPAKKVSKVYVLSTYFSDPVFNTSKVHIPGRTFPVTQLHLDEIVKTLWKIPGLRKWLGPGILSSGLNMDEKEWKRTNRCRTK